jgi:Flp pilus assembly protein TadG
LRTSTSFPKLFAFADRLGRNTRGAAAVEFAMIAPLFFLLAIGGMEVSIALHKGSSVQWAIEKAARTAMITPAIDQAKFQDLVDDNLAAMSVEAQVNVTYSTETGSEIVLGRAQATYVHTVRPIFLPSFDVSFDSDVSFPQAT